METTGKNWGTLTPLREKRKSVEKGADAKIGKLAQMGRGQRREAAGETERETRPRMIGETHDRGENDDAFLPFVVAFSHFSHPFSSLHARGVASHLKGLAESRR